MVRQSARHGANARLAAPPRRRHDARDPGGQPRHCAGDRRPVRLRRLQGRVRTGRHYPQFPGQDQGRAMAGGDGQLARCRCGRQRVRFRHADEPRADAGGALTAASRWRGGYWLPALVVGLLWLARYAHDFGFPAAPPWAGWFDQSRYLASVRALMQLDFDAAQHWYPPAYALSALPFAWITPNTPFLIADMVLFALTAAAFSRAMRPFGIGPWLGAAIFALSTLAISQVAILWVEPWTTTLSAALLYGLFAAMAMLFESEGKPPAGPLVAVGALIAALPATR